MADHHGRATLHRATINFTHTPRFLIVMANSQKATLSEVMNLAWQFIKKNGLRLSEALKIAWRNVKLRIALHRKIVRFTFKKVDGTLREAWGTLAADMLPSHGDGRTPNPTIQVYFDTEKGAWRCFKKINLISYSYEA